VNSLGLGGASALAVASNIFLGMIESPIVIRAYLDKLTRSEIFLLMTVGFSTVAGSTMVAYATILAPVLPNAAGHVLVASIVSAPAGVLLARILVPEKPGEGGAYAEYDSALKYDSAIDAISKGTADGLMVVLNISAILIVFVALMTLVNMMIGGFWLFGEPVTVERLLGFAFAPLAWATGVEWSEAGKAGWLLGVKLTLTEFVAFIELGGIPDGEISERTRRLMTYALCGFANIGSVGISVTGLSILIPERREMVLGLVWKALMGGFLATLVTTSVVGALPDSIFTG
jgi:concentrative nucleoside transporter, CNT family